LVAALQHLDKRNAALAKADRVGLVGGFMPRGQGLLDRFSVSGFFESNCFFKRQDSRGHVLWKKNAFA
jgi:hypothetical protein